MAPKTGQWKPKVNRSEDDRGGGGSKWISLKEGEKFTGYPLFDADPEKSDPAYLENQEHWLNDVRRSVPCADANCYYCEDGDRPKNRAYTLWVVTKDVNGKEIEGGELRIFRGNWNVIKLLTEMRKEGDKIKGQAFRVSCVDDRGNYSFTVRQQVKPLTATEVKEWLKKPEAPDFMDMITTQLTKAMEALSVARALDDEDDEPSQTRQKAKLAPEPEEEDTPPEPEPEPEDEPEAGAWPVKGEVVVKVEEVDEDNFIMVSAPDLEGVVKIWGTPDGIDFTELESGDSIEVTYFTDGDDDYVAEAFEKVAAATGGELPAKLDGVEFEIVGDPHEANGTIPVKSDDEELEFTLYVISGVAMDWDDYVVGTKILITAEKDVDGDMLSRTAPEIVKAEAKGGKRKGAPAAAAKGKGK